MKPIIKILDVATNQEIEREMDDEELEQYNNLIAIYKKMEAEEKSKTAAKNSAFNKLIDLGLTEEEAKAFLG